ncbi:Pycsar system effector family protein [Sphingomonas sp. CFBP 13720]|uniref:Pycsar system effector family protein n=1 Tax=Sphingomonas sp. CFBP 13720 TaxID=2775302 RepID=UPI0017819C03|nr:Pycsar system effector family protein [Sphingomonas sp. CFBP 13720]MBD8679254.1 hypothetical protein [Sphingomonas sp. CFBP 13720]
MAKNDQQEAYEKVLTATFSRVNDWVKFAEAKNAALLAFSSAWAVAIGNALAKDGGASAQYASYLPVAGCLFIAAAVIAIFSFLPRISLSKFFRGEQAIARPLNLVFFGDIAAIPIENVASRFRDQYMPIENDTLTESYATDLTCQIHVNSTIANRKFKQFKFACWFALAAIVVLAIPAAKYVFIFAIRFAGEFAK